MACRFPKALMYLHQMRQFFLMKSIIPMLTISMDFDFIGWDNRLGSRKTSDLSRPTLSICNLVMEDTLGKSSLRKATSHYQILTLFAILVQGGIWLQMRFV